MDMVAGMVDSKQELDNNPNQNLSLDERRFLFEQKKHDDETKAAAQTVALQEKELARKRTDPVMVAVVGGVIAAFASVFVSYVNGKNQIAAEADRHDHTMAAEKFRAESMMISESVKSQNKLQKACRLQELIEFHLITDERLKSNVNNYLRLRRGDETLVATHVRQTVETPAEEYSEICTIETKPSQDELPQIVASAPNEASQESKPNSGGNEDGEIRPSKGALIQSLDYSTGWMGGGYSQSEACAQAVASFSSQYQGKILERGEASESSRKDLLGHVTYNYYCNVKVYEPMKVKRF